MMIKFIIAYGTQEPTFEDALKHYKVYPTADDLAEAIGKKEALNTFYHGKMKIKIYRVIVDEFEINS